MNATFLDTPIEYLKGVGPQRAEVLKSELNVFKISDLLSIYPIRYIDKSSLSNIRSIDSNTTNVLFVAKLLDFQLIGNGAAKRLSAKVTDGSGWIELVWFKSIHSITKFLKIDAEYRIYGKVSEFNGKFNISHPEIKLHNPNEQDSQFPLEPVYPLTEKLKSRFMDSKYLMGLMQQIVTNSAFEPQDFIPDSVVKPLKLISRKAALYYIHFPKDEKIKEAAVKRLKFEEMFIHSMRFEKSKINRLRQMNGYAIKNSGQLVNDFYHNYLKFELTNAQKRVIKEIRADMGIGRQMNRLVQGDVGSGKTIVALFAILLCIDNGFQASMMAPTEILATQHYFSFKDLLGNLPVNVALLTGSTKKKEREKILLGLKSGEIQVLVGTHALIEKDVEFKQFGLAVIDEQHKFGVAQRAQLWNRYNVKPHVLVMTATPIPRTLAMTIHGELDVSVIDELPKDRIPIKTIHRENKYRSEVMAFVKREIEKGRQIYIVYPLIEESGKLDLNDLMNGYDYISSFFPVPQYQISLMHGKMKAEVKEFEMMRFKQGITQIMISTTVIEVGVNVPNASVMIIEDANRFGLSQLHQLRGRVGRGAEQSYCVLITKDELNYTAKKRIKTMCMSSDGFQIAKVDLELRGPGDVLGTRQSGLPDFKILNLINDEKIIDLSQRASAFVLKNDPELKHQENQHLLEYLIQHQEDRFWSQIS
jgi:ATP-dependent DNA helicase RecG